MNINLSSLGIIQHHIVPNSIPEASDKQHYVLALLSDLYRWRDRTPTCEKDINIMITSIEIVKRVYGVQRI